MLQRIFGAVREVFVPPVVDCVAFAKLHQEHPTPQKRPGTMAEATATATDALKALERAPYGSYDRWLPERIEEIHEMLAAHSERHHPEKGWCTCTRRWEASSAGESVGGVNEVSRLFGPEHFIGCEVSEGPDGWTLTHIEMLDRNLLVLRKDGRVRGIEQQCIMRMESRGGIHYV